MSSGGGQDSKEKAPSSTPKRAKTTRADLKQLVLKFNAQLTVGCGNPRCPNVQCASHPGFQQLGKPAAIKRALELVKQGAELCPSYVPGLELHSVKALLEECEKEGSYRAAIRKIGAVFSNREALQNSFTTDGPDGNGPSDKGEAIDYEGLEEAYTLIIAQDACRNSLSFALRGLCNELKLAAAYPLSPIQLRPFILLLVCPLWNDPDHAPEFKTLLRSFMRMDSGGAKQTLQGWVNKWPQERISSLVATLQQYISVQWYTTERVPDVACAVGPLDLLYNANKEQAREARLRRDKNAVIKDFRDFYNDAINEELDLRLDFRSWKLKDRFSFCNYSWILDAASKSTILRFDASVQMRQQIEESMVFGGMVNSPYLVLQVHRQNLIPTTLMQLQLYEKADYKKPLKVKFVGEAGVDEGGVQKEFFQLIIAQIFDAKFGMFTYSEETRTYWFNGDSLESSNEFELVGILLGLAIYNSVILDVRFPDVTYKKLMGISPDLQDLVETMPELGRGLEQLLVFDGDVEETYCRDFTVTYDSFGESRTVELKEGGADLALTNENRQEYVDLEVDYRLNRAAKQQFQAFFDGFHVVCGGDALDLFRWEELELLICGSPELDFEALEEATRYEDGYHAEHPTVINFWKVVHAMSLEDKKKLLCFCTGSDRVPIKGLGSLRFTISRNGTAEEAQARLPSSHTCFNHLLLPEYDTIETLKEKLGTAVLYSKGFGLM